LTTRYASAAVRKKAGQQEDVMGKAFILWLLGVPLGIVILLYIFFFR
jgi:hypothetical protein